MLYNETLTATYAAMGNLCQQWKEAVKKRMGWKSDNPFYYRIRGQVACTPAERDVFIQTLEEMQIKKPADLFPAAEKENILAE